MIRADLHVHTRQSVDSAMSYDQLIRACQYKNIDCIAVADHGTTKGAKELTKIAPFRVIICEEILTQYGEVMGMFLQDDIPNKIALEQAVRLIREQDGLICIPHPYDVLRPSSLRNTLVLESLADDVDIIEVFNARTFMPGIFKRARSLALRHNKLMSAGTDAHSPIEIGCTYVEMADFRSKTEFLSSLSVGNLHCRKSSPFIHLISTGVRLSKRYQRE